MIKNFLKKFWPLIVIFVVWFIFASPYFLKGKAPFAASYQLNNFAPWDAYPQYTGPVKNGAMPDVITQIYPWKHLVMQIWKSGQVPLWNPYSFAGTPLLANYQSAVLSPFNLIFFVLPFVDGWSLLVLLQPLLAGIFTYVFVRSLKRSKVGSLISAVPFMFCGFITAWMGYATLAYAILFLPLSLFAIEKYYESSKSKFLILLSLSVPLSFFSGHFQISIYFFIAVILYVLFKFATTNDFGKFLKVILFIAFGLLLSMPQLLPSIEFYLQSFRSDIFQKGEVIPFAYLPTLLSPDFFGNPVTRNDWFGHYAEWNGFIGVIPLLLAFYSLTLKNKSQSLFFFLVGIVALALSLDSKLVDLVVALKIPVLSTSAASRIIVVYSFMFSVASAFGFDKLMHDIKERNLKPIFVVFSIFALVFLFLWGIVFLKLYIPLDKILIAKSNLKLPTLIFVVSIVALIIPIVNKKFLYIFGLVILILVSFDMLRFATKWQEFGPKNLVFVNVPASQAFSEITGPGRVIGNFGGEAAVYYRLPSLEGYDALYIKRYGEFAASITDGRLKESFRSVVMFPIDSPYTASMINLLDVKYVVHKAADGRAGWTFPFWAYPDNKFSQIYKDNSYEIYQNSKTFGHAFLVGKYEVNNNPQGIINILTSKSTDLRNEIVLEENSGIQQEDGDMGSAKIVKYLPNEINIEVSAAHSGLLFLSDSYYNGWKATVDGVNTKIYRADYAFRAVVVPQGQHTIKFTYQPFSFILGIYLAIAGLLGVITFSLIPRILVRKASS